MEWPELTPEQKKAFRSLERAFKKCDRAGLYVWDDYGHISAANGHVISEVAAMVEIENCYSESHPVSGEDIDTITPECWRGSNADDPLRFRLK